MKTLFELATKKLFYKEYMCYYCEMLDFEKQKMIQHIIAKHDETGSKIKLKIFYCKTCHQNVRTNEFIYHKCRD